MVQKKVMNNNIENLLLAERQAKQLFEAAAKQGLLVPGKKESELAAEIVTLARESFGIDNFWHKKIVRTGPNTLQPYNGNPPDRIIQDNDILFLDFGPIVNGWESDLGRTYVLGNDPLKLKLQQDAEAAWQEANRWYAAQEELTGAACFHYLKQLAKKYGWEWGGEIGGHIVGKYPHEQPDDPADLSLDIHPDNHNSILLRDKEGNKRYWILEIHFIDREAGIGAFFEQLFTEQ